MNRRAIIKALANLPALPALASMATPSTAARPTVEAPRKFTGSGWYAHKGENGCCSVHLIACDATGHDRKKPFTANPWPAIRPDNARRMTPDEIERFIYRRIETPAR